MRPTSCRNIDAICLIRESSANAPLTSRAYGSKSFRIGVGVKTATEKWASNIRRTGHERGVWSGRPKLRRHGPWVCVQQTQGCLLAKRRSVRRPEIRELTEGVGVGTQPTRWTVTLGEETEPVVDDVVGEHAAVRVLRRLRRIVGEHVGQDALLVDGRDGLLVGVTAGVPEQVDEHADPALAIVHR